METHRNSDGCTQDRTPVSTRAWYGAAAPPPLDRLAELDADDLFGDGELDRTIAVPTTYDLRTGFTGRHQALEELQRLWRTAIDTQAITFAVVTGEPGMGKSRVVSELARICRESTPGMRLLFGAAEGPSRPFAPFARLLDQRFGIAPGAALADARDRISRGVADVLPAPRVTEIAHLLAHAMGYDFDDSPVVGPLLESPRALETRTFLALRRFLAADAERRPLLLALDNLELAGPETINLVQYLAAGLRTSPILLVATARASLYEHYPSFGGGDVAPARIELAPLVADDLDALLCELLAPLGTIPERLLVHARTLGGSPRAVHELVRLLLESDCIVRGPGATWQLDAARLVDTALPRTYDELVASRLAVMDPVDRRALEMAAVIGEVCWVDAILALERADGLHRDRSASEPDGPTLGQIAAADDHSRERVQAAVGKLIEREWLTELGTPTLPGERELRFSYPTLWRAVYDGIDADVRRRYHRRAAQWLELRPEGHGPPAQEEVARHLERAGDAREAAGRYRRAAEGARDAYHNERALRLYERAIACVGDWDLAARLHLWHDLGSLYELIGDFEAALGAFERMLRLSWVGASKAKAAVAFNKIGRVWRRKGDLKLSLEYLERGAELFRSASDQRGIAGSLDDIGKVLHLLGRYDEAHAKITEALARRGRGGDKRSIAASLSNLGIVQQGRGQFAAAFNCHREALELRREAGDRWGAVVSQNNLAVLAYDVGDHAEARAGWTAALADAEGMGALPYAALILTNLGALALEENKLDEARGRLDDALEIVEDIEDRQLESECTRQLALLEIQLGQIDLGRALAERSLSVATQAGLKEKEGQALLALGKIASASLYDAGRPAADHEPGVPLAESYFQRGLAVLRGIGNDASTARGLEMYAQYKMENGAPDSGKDLLREALVIYSRLGMRRGERVQAQLQTV